MPKFKITDIDNTGSVQSTNTSNVVYIPGKSIYKGEGTVIVNVAPTLFTSVASLKAKNLDEKGNAVYFDTSALSYKLATHLLSLGMSVLYEGVVEDSSGVPTIDWTRLQDRGLYDIRFLTMGGYNITQSEMITCADKRGDCTALMDHPVSMTSATGEKSQVGLVREYFEGKGKSSYAAAFTPGFTSYNEELGGTSTKGVHIPASFGYLFAYASSIQSNSDWDAVAGGTRGLISELGDIDYEYTSAEIEQLNGRAKTGEVELDDEADNVGCAVNAIAYVRPFGNIIWSNRTMKENDATKKTTATSFLNVRNMVNTIKKKMYDASRKFAFEQNSDLLWVNFKSQINPTLEKMKSGNGILGYKWTQLSTTAKARIRARLTIIPIEAVEDFELEVELSDSLTTSEE